MGCKQYEGGADHKFMVQGVQNIYGAAHIPFSIFNTEGGMMI